MNSAVPGPQSSKVPDDIQYAVQVKLTPDVLQALLNAQKSGDHVSIRFAEENKTDVWTIGNQQFAFKAAKEDKSELLEVVRCSGDPAEGAPCSPIACVYKKLHFPKSAAEAQLGWRQAQAQRKQPEKRVAKLLDAGFNEKKGVTSVKHTVRHTTPPASRPVPIRPASKLVLSQSRHVQRQVTPPPPPPSAAEVPARPAVKPLNPPKPRSLKPSLQKKEPLKPAPTPAVAKVPAPGQARPTSAPRQRTPYDTNPPPAKALTPSPQQRTTPLLHSQPPRAPARSSQPTSPDGVLSSRDEGARRPTCSLTKSDEAKKVPSPQNHTSTLRPFEGHSQQARRSDSHPWARREASSKSSEGKTVSRSPPSQNTGLDGKRQQHSPPSQTGTHDSKRPNVSPPSQYAPGVGDSLTNEPSDPHHTSHKESCSRQQDRPSSAARSFGHENTSQNHWTSSSPDVDPMHSSHRPDRSSPPTYEDIHRTGSQERSQERSSPSDGPHPENSSRQDCRTRFEDSSHNDRPSSQESWLRDGGSQRPVKNPYSMSQGADPKRPHRTPSLPNLHRMEETNSRGDRLCPSPPITSSEGALRPGRGPSFNTTMAGERPQLDVRQQQDLRRPADAKQQADARRQSDPAQPVAGREPFSLGKHSRSQSMEDGELYVPAAKKPSPRPNPQSIPTSIPPPKPAIENSSPSQKRSRDDSMSPPSVIHDGNPAPTKKLVLKIRRPSDSGTPSTGGSSGGGSAGLSAVAQAHATPEVSMRGATLLLDPHESHLGATQKGGTHQDARQTGAMHNGRHGDGHQRDAKYDSARNINARQNDDWQHDVHLAGKRGATDLHDRQMGRQVPSGRLSSEFGQAGSQSLVDTQPTSSESPAKAAMAYTPEQDEDEKEYLEFVNRKPGFISPVHSYEEYQEAKGRYRELHALYYKLRHKSESFMRDLNALHSAVQSHGDSAQAADFRRQALELVGRKGGVFERWQQALGNLKVEICALKDAAAAWRGLPTGSSNMLCSVRAGS